MDFMEQWGTMLGAWSKQHESLFKELRDTLNNSGQWATENGEPGAMVEFYNNLAKALGNTVMPHDSGAAAFSNNPFDYLMDPSAWIKAAAADVKLFGETNGDAASFAAAGDLSEKFSAAKDSWSALNASTTAYHEVILAAWAATGQQFIGAVNDKRAAGDEITGWRELVEMWRTIADDNLLELQRSDDFLGAQREFFRAGMNHRLKEQQIVADLCEKMHIPTRDEVDEVHKTVTELRRDLRAVKRELAELRRASTGGQAATRAKAKAKAPDAHKTTANSSKWNEK